MSDSQVLDVDLDTNATMFQDPSCILKRILPYLRSSDSFFERQRKYVICCALFLVGLVIGFEFALLNITLRLGQSVPVNLILYHVFMACPAIIVTATFAMLVTKQRMPRAWFVSSNVAAVGIYLIVQPSMRGRSMIHAMPLFLVSVMTNAMPLWLVFALATLVHGYHQTLLFFPGLLVPYVGNVIDVVGEGVQILIFKVVSNVAFMLFFHLLWKLSLHEIGRRSMMLTTVARVGSQLAALQTSQAERTLTRASETNAGTETYGVEGTVLAALFQLTATLQAVKRYVPPYVVADACESVMQSEVPTAAPRGAGCVSPVVALSQARRVTSRVEQRVSICRVVFSFTASRHPGLGLKDLSTAVMFLCKESECNAVWWAEDSCIILWAPSKPNPAAPLLALELASKLVHLVSLQDFGLAAAVAAVATGLGTVVVARKEAIKDDHATEEEPTDSYVGIRGPVLDPLNAQRSVVDELWRVSGMVVSQVPHRMPFCIATCDDATFRSDDHREATETAPRGRFVFQGIGYMSRNPPPHEGVFQLLGESPPSAIAPRHPSPLSSTTAVDAAATDSRFTVLGSSAHWGRKGSSSLDMMLSCSALSTPMSDTAASSAIVVSRFPPHYILNPNVLHDAGLATHALCLFLEGKVDVALLQFEHMRHIPRPLAVELFRNKMFSQRHGLGLH